MTYPELEQYITDLLTFFIREKGLTVHPEDRLQEDYRLSSMDAVDIYTDLLEQFDVDLYTDVRGYGTVRGLCDGVWQELQTK